MLEAKQELRRGFVFRSQPPSSSPPSLLLPLPFPVSAVPHIPGLRGGGRPRPQPAVPGHLPELLVLLPQRRGGGEQEAQLLLRHLVRRGRRPHHLVSESAAHRRRGYLQNAPTPVTLLSDTVFFIGLLLFLTGGLPCKGSASEQRLVALAVRLPLEHSELLLVCCFAAQKSRFLIFLAFQGKKELCLRSR